MFGVKAAFKSSDQLSLIIKRTVRYFLQQCEGYIKFIFKLQGTPTNCQSVKCLFKKVFRKKHRD